MKYTVKQLAAISGISVRTLHWYDKMSLLKPSYYGENNYRYYKKEEMLKLQQILFFRELGLKLSDIKEALSQSDIDNAKTLKSHKKTLEKKIKRFNKLIASIEKTILYLETGISINLEEIFEGFSEEKQKFYEDYLMESGVDESRIEEYKENTKNWTKDDWLSHKKDCDKVHEDLISSIRKDLSQNSEAVQNIIQRHFEVTSILWTPDKKSYTALADLYGAHPDFVSFYHTLHPKLLGFLQDSMKLYAEQKLS